MKKSIFMPKISVQDDKIVASNDTVKQNLMKIKKKTLLKLPFLESILKRINIFDRGASTHGGLAATDGNTVEINGGAVVNDTETGVFALAHEAKHIEKNDVSKMSSYSDKRVANIAADALINEDLKNSNITTDKPVVQIAGANAYGADKLYNIITETAQFIANDIWLGKKPAVTQTELNNSVFGNHELWNRVVSYHAEKTRQLQNPDQEKDKNPDQEKDKNPENELPVDPKEQGNEKDKNPENELPVDPKEQGNDFEHFEREFARRGQQREPETAVI
jgi:hypothetical protein